MDKYDEKNLSLYNGFAYKVIEADKAVDLGLYEEVKLKNGKTRKVKATGLLKQKVITIPALILKIHSNNKGLTRLLNSINQQIYYKYSNNSALHVFLGRTKNLVGREI